MLNTMAGRLRRKSMEQFTVQLNNATCTVCSGAGVLGRAGALLRQHVPQVRRWALAADEAVSAFYGEWVQGSLRAAGLESRLFPLPQGESAKTAVQYPAA